MDVSVITPIYKGNRYINGIFQMIADNAQKAPQLDIELVLVNDSPEIPLEYDESLVQNFSLKIVDNKKNLGIHGARKSGLHSAEGKYILFFDQDDSLTDTAIASQYQYVKNADAVVSNGWVKDNTGTKRPLFIRHQQNRVNDVDLYFYIGNLIASPGMCLIRKDCIPNCWAQEEMKTNGADDWLLWTGFLLDGRHFEINPDFTYTHKSVGTNTSDDETKMIESSVEAAKIMQPYYLNEKFNKIYQRRLAMREMCTQKNNAFLKYLMYFLNFDIAFKLFIFKKG
ncbi:glycosyltransferase family 2 protein [Bifidobacterium adolescentis]|uniref:glycosyltransferase family 2 protein n=1 Tax=Bifidobacterium adolescentis TaxID=1680 RepID=UPI0022E2E846|nr:glycosyltransferase [Bifidobacterium adolescentis]